MLCIFFIEEETMPLKIFKGEFIIVSHKTLRNLSIQAISKPSSILWNVFYYGDTTHLLENFSENHLLVPVHI